MPPSDRQIRRLARRGADAGLADFEAGEIWSTKDLGAYSLAFDGRYRLLMGGVFSKSPRWEPNRGVTTSGLPA